jgi:C2 domain
MDPFVVISFGKKVFRTRIIRHSRNPVWDEKLLFHVRRYETAFKGSSAGSGHGFVCRGGGWLSLNERVHDATVNCEGNGWGNET